MTTKRKRLENFILPLLKCIVCYRSRLEIENDTIHCRNCKATYPIHNDIPIMTTQPSHALEYSPGVVVENSYPQQWIDFVDNAGGEPVLDMGSGNNPDILPNLVKLEIFALPNVDVVGFGENLPFQESVFKTVFSGAVIEHVQDPIKVVSNIHRVLKGDGQVYIETAFLQPVHAYPSHYFNMTKTGLEYLCSDFEKLDSGVKPHQYPSFTLSWILNSWQAKLSEKAKKKFLNTKIKDILNEYKTNVFSQKWMENFSSKDREELACGVFFHGKKRQEKKSFWEKWLRRIKNSIKCLLGRY